MALPAPADPAAPGRYTVERYLRLVGQGVLAPEDRVELLEGVVVAMSPRNPLHDAAVSLADRALMAAVGGRAAVRCQLSLVIAPHSVPEPDVAVVPGHEGDYARAHPGSALLVVEVADSTLAQDRITKAAVYASAGIPEYWLVNLRDDRIEVFREPDAAAARYGVASVAGRGERLDLVALPGASVLADDLLPPR